MVILLIHDTHVYYQRSEIPSSHDALSSSHMLGVAQSQVKKTKYLPSGYMTWKCASIKVHKRTCQMLNWFEKQIKYLFTLCNKPFEWTFVSRWGEGRALGIGCGDQISGNEMKGRLQDWVVNRHPHRVVKTDAETSSKLRTFALRKTLLRQWKDKLQTRRKYSQITYLTKDFYAEYIKDSQNSTVR